MTRRVKATIGMTPCERSSYRVLRRAGYNVQPGAKAKARIERRRFNQQRYQQNQLIISQAYAPMRRPEGYVDPAPPKRAGPKVTIKSQPTKPPAAAKQITIKLPSNASISKGGVVVTRSKGK